MSTSFILTLDIFAKHAVIVLHGAIVSYFAKGEVEIRQQLSLLSVHKYIQIVNLTAVGGHVLLDSAANCLGVDLRDMTKEGKDRYDTSSWRQAVDESHVLFHQLAYEFRPFIAGGIRTTEMALSYLSHSTRRVVSSRADVLLSLPPDVALNRTILAIDLDRDKRLMMLGRSEVSDMSLESLLASVSGKLKKITITFHENEGTDESPDWTTVAAIQEDCKRHHLSLTIAGGASLPFMRKCFEHGISVQLGRLFHSGQATIGELMVELLHSYFFPSSSDDDSSAMRREELKTNKTIDVIICQTGVGPLSLVHMSSSSLQTSIDSRVLTLFSQSRSRIWTKGATSGNLFTVTKVLVNCERNSLLVYVKPATSCMSSFCHTGHVSCFGDVGPQQASLDHWLDVLIDKKQRGELSFKTNNFMCNDVLLRHKIREEAEEILFSRNIHESTCEVADIMYFIMLFMINQGISMDRLQVEMLSRHFTPSSVSSSSSSHEEKAETTVRLAVTDRISFSDISHALRCDVQPYKGRALHISCDNPHLNLFLIKPKDVYLYLNEDRFDGVICYSDLVHDLNMPLYEACPPFGPAVRICVIAREAEPVNPKLIYSEFYGLANEWRKKQTRFQKLKLRHTHGKTESLLIAGHCDLAVVTVDSGETLLANNLHIIDTIEISQACVYVSMKAMSRFQHALHV